MPLAYLYFFLYTPFPYELQHNFSGLKVSMQQNVFRSKFLLVFAICATALICGCSAEASNQAETANSAKIANIAAAPKNTSIDIQPNSPADTVRAFYQDLREKKFREAIYLTNLRPAVEGLTDAELKDFQIDLEALAGQVPQQIEINGEIISGNDATVTAKLPGEEQDKLELQQIKLRKAGDVWIIVSVDAETEAAVKKEGKNYFYKLRIDTHHDEARQMLDRISKAELAYSLQNGGAYADIATLVEAGLLPPDAKTSDTTGYNYLIKVPDDKKSWSASAVPAIYGKTGSLSFAVDLDDKNRPHLTSKDNGGKPLN